MVAWLNPIIENNLKHDFWLLREPLPRHEAIRRSTTMMWILVFPHLFLRADVQYVRMSLGPLQEAVSRRWRGPLLDDE